jgi:hypothetical protein
VDLRRLYRASGGAARELLSLATALQDAAASAAVQEDAGAGAPAVVNYVAQLQQRRAQDKSTVQALVASAATSGQQLLGSLGSAPAITQQLDAPLAAAGGAGAGAAGLKAAAHAAVGQAQQKVAALQKAIAELDQEQQLLEGKWALAGPVRQWPHSGARWGVRALCACRLPHLRLGSHSGHA